MPGHLPLAAYFALKCWYLPSQHFLSPRYVTTNVKDDDNDKEEQEEEGEENLRKRGGYVPDWRK